MTTNATDKILFQKPAGFFDTFERRPGPLKQSMHYCPGCGHGVLAKLLAEALADFDMLENTVLMCPVGCSVFMYYYFNMASISVPHGRAPAVATGISRSEPDVNTVVYQGDGDLGAIGFNNFIQAANRGENMTVLFVNNAIYGMTGGQMAPTTLPGQKTLTCPEGRLPMSDGMPLKVSEMVAALDTPIYVERVALSSIKRVRAARRALRKGLRYMKERKGFSLIEFLTACPTNIKLSPPEADRWVEENMVPHFPIKCFKDVGEERFPITRPTPVLDPDLTAEALIAKAHSKASDLELPAAKLPQDELKIRCAGFGGQGVLRLGTMIASAANAQRLEVSWLPSYGPEMRGGTANCSVVLSEDQIGSPFADEADILIIMNQPSMDRFAPELREGGILVYDSCAVSSAPALENRRVCPVNATEIANNLGSARCANAVLLGALSAYTDYLSDDAFKAAVADSFKGKQSVIALNHKAFEAGRDAARAIG